MNDWDFLPSGVVSAAAPLVALGVDVQLSGRLLLDGGPNTQAVYRQL